MGNVIGSTEQMINKINDVLRVKKDAVVSIVNDKLTISVFALLEKNLKNVKEINFVIRDTKFVPEKSEISHEFEIMDLCQYIGQNFRFFNKITPSLTIQT